MVGIVRTRFRSEKKDFTQMKVFFLKLPSSSYQEQLSKAFITDCRIFEIYYLAVFLYGPSPNA
jgi:hypothetical protein